MTGLSNISEFRTRCTEYLSLASRANRPVTLMLLDFDHFKQINDSYGHLTGDEVLKKVACIFTEICRDTDVISRIGGDEFAILLVHPTDHESAKRVADRIIASFAEPLMVGGHEIKVTVSIGISMYPNDGDDIEELRKTADLALYKIKSLGRNDYMFYHMLNLQSP